MNDMLQIDETGTALAILPKSQLPTILAADENDILGSLLKELEGWEPDVSTIRGRKEIASKAQKIRVAKADFERLAKTLKEDAIKTQRNVNAEFNILEERMNALIARVRGPLDEYEAAESARIRANENAIAAIEATTDRLADRTSDEIMGLLNGMPDFEWSVEFRAKAERVTAGVRARLELAYQAALKREAEAAEEAERLRLAAIEAQRLHDEQIAAEAAARATREAEQKAAREALEAEQKAQVALRAQAVAAEQERAASLRREVEAAEALAKAERERVAAEEKAERDRIAAEAKAKADANAAVEAERQRAIKEHQRSDYHRRMLQHVKNCGFGFIDNEPQPIGILQRELTEKIKYDEENFGDLLAEALAAKGAALALIQKSIDDSDRRHAEEAERQRVAQAAAKQKAEDERRAADKAHRATINRGALVGIMAVLNDNWKEEDELSPEILARKIVEAIAKGNVSHVRIEY